MKGTIKSNKEIDRLFSEGLHISAPFVAVKIAATPEQRDRNGRVAYIAGKKLGNAVMRNACKRHLREFVRLQGGPWPGYDVVVMARSNKVAAMTPQELSEKCEKLISRLKKEVGNE